MRLVRTGSLNAAAQRLGPPRTDPPRPVAAGGLLGRRWRLEAVGVDRASGPSTGARKHRSLTLGSLLGTLCPLLVADLDGTAALPTPAGLQGGGFKFAPPPLLPVDDVFGGEAGRAMRICPMVSFVAPDVAAVCWLGR